MIEVYPVCQRCLVRKPAKSLLGDKQLCEQCFNNVTAEQQATAQGLKDAKSQVATKPDPGGRILRLI